VAAMPRPFACVHLRLLEEYLVHHADKVHGNRTRVLQALAGFVAEQAAAGTTAFYVATDSDLRSTLAAMPPPARFHTCFDHGCTAATFGADSVQGYVDLEVCAAADVFRGNTFSSYTLAVCGRRGDQECRDLFDRTIDDGRLLL